MVLSDEERWVLAGWAARRPKTSQAFGLRSKIAQAIDRTHRIGQTKNIFAYRMICKDTIEDKILQLQEKKRILAKDLIAEARASIEGT